MMRFHLLSTVCLLLLTGPAAGQAAPALPGPSGEGRHRAAESPCADSALLARIRRADSSFSLEQLSAVVQECRERCSRSDSVSLALTAWLRENHAIYRGKSATEAGRFRGFLLHALGSFPPNEPLYAHVRYELQFADHVYTIAAAAHTARIFAGAAGELVQLMQPYLGAAFRDEWLDLNTVGWAYPLQQPTRARHEVIRTLQTLGPEAWSCVGPLNTLAQQAAGNGDTALQRLAHEAAAAIEAATPACCRKAGGPVAATAAGTAPRSKRKEVLSNTIQLMDQEGRQLTWAQLKGRPFVFTFFYTSCSNALKCAATVDRLARLQQQLAAAQLEGKAGLYAMTYDPEGDGPAALKSYGTLYGIRFNRHVRFLLPLGDAEQAIARQLDVRVNYGYGSVNQHGIQLFVFDKKGRLSAVYDNEQWKVEEVFRRLVNLIAE